VGRLPPNYVLSDPYVDVALVGAHDAGGRKARLSELRVVELNNEIG
jgi:hypothetical protein